MMMMMLACCACSHGAGASGGTGLLSACRSPGPMNVSVLLGWARHGAPLGDNLCLSSGVYLSGVAVSLAGHCAC